MIPGLDSAQPPTAAQVAAARAAGIGVWSGYLATAGAGGSAFGLLRVWTQAEFDVARGIGGAPIAFCSGWDDPVGCRDLAAAWGVRLCLDVEDGIRGDGAWVQPWLDASGAALYGGCGIHAGRNAAFDVLAWYPIVPVAATWNDIGCPPRPAGPCGWQSQGSHQEFGLDVDRGWYDDWFGGDMLTQDDINAIADAVGGKLFGFTPDTATYLTKITQEVVNGTAQSPTGLSAQLAALLAAVKAIQPAGGLTAAQAILLQEAHDAIIRIEKAEQGA